MLFRNLSKGGVKFNFLNLSLWIVVIGIFSERYIELLILLVSCFQIALSGNKILISKKYLYVFFCCLGVSFVTITYCGYSYDRMLGQFFILFIYTVCYYNIFRINNQLYSLNNLFDRYLFISHVISILGILQFVLYFLFNVDFLSFIYGYGRTPEVLPRVMRVYSVLDEPGYLSTLLTPAFIYYCYSSYFQISISTWRKFTVYLAFFLTFATTSYAIIIVAILYKYLFLSKDKLTRLISGNVLMLFIICLFYLIVNSSENTEGVFKDSTLKINETYNAFSDMDPVSFEELNLSSYSIMTNLWVALNSPSRIFGSGLGSHEQNYASLYQSNFMYYGLNKHDGYSLFNRVYSELGLAGILLLLFFLFKCFNKKNLLNLSIFFLLLTLLVRGGSYIRYGTIFFFFFYYYTRKINFK